MLVTPIKDPHNFRCAAALKKIVPRRATVNVPLFFSGNLEFALSSSGRRVHAITNKYVIYEFWKCAFHDPHRIIKISEHLFKNRDKNMLYYLQEDWPKYRDPYLRSSLFFLLNRFSSTGYQSHGELDYDNYNPIALNRLKKLNDNNFTLELIAADNFLEKLKEISTKDYILMPIGAFSFNFFEHGKNEGWETTKVNHTLVRDFLKETDSKTILVYKKHGALESFFKGFNKLYSNKYGNATTDISEAEEVLIANFRIN